MSHSYEASHLHAYLVCTLNPRSDRGQNGRVRRAGNLGRVGSPALPAPEGPGVPPVTFGIGGY